MRVSRSVIKSLAALNQSAPGGAAGASQNPTPSSPTDQAQLSQLGSYLASALSGSPAHMSKLMELGIEVSKGHYQVDAYAVSGSIIQHSIEFGGSGYSALST